MNGLCECGCGGKTNLMKVNYPPRGLVTGKPRRFIFPHQNKVQYPGHTVDGAGCWNYNGYITKFGYAGKVRSSDGKAKSAHTVAYERKHGIMLPRRTALDHLCRNRRCINPDHLEVVTTAENVRRGLLTKLTKVQVEEIRRLAPTTTKAKLAKAYGVCASTIYSIIRFVNWRTDL